MASKAQLTYSAPDGLMPGAWPVRAVIGAPNGSLPVRFRQFNACGFPHPGRWLPDSCR
jgi:hypothetical protein